MDAAAPVRLLIADDHAFTRRGLRALFGQTADVLVVGEASDGSEAVDMVDRLEPDVVLMDVELPTLDGIAATRAILARHPRTRVVVLTMHDDPQIAAEARRAGAHKFLVKGVETARLLAATTAAGTGDGATLLV